MSAVETLNFPFRARGSLDRLLLLRCELRHEQPNFAAGESHESEINKPRKRSSSAFDQTRYRPNPKRGEQPTCGDVKVEVIAQEISGKWKWVTTYLKCVIIRIRSPVRALTELQQRREGLHRVNDGIEWRHTLKFRDGALCWGTLFCSGDKVVRIADMKKKCPKENHCETDRKCPPWCITVPDRSSKKVVPPPSLAEKVREPRPVAILFDHYTPGFALMSHLAQHRRELLVRLWNELVPRLFFPFRSSSADKIPFSLQPFLSNSWLQGDLLYGSVRR